MSAHRDKGGGIRRARESSRVHEGDHLEGPQEAAEEKSGRQDARQNRSQSVEAMDVDQRGFAHDREDHGSLLAEPPPSEATNSIAGTVNIASGSSPGPGKASAMVRPRRRGDGSVRSSSSGVGDEGRN